MDPAEEQAMEVEALESIYMDDFKKVGDAPLQMEIHLTPGEEENHVAIFLDVVNTSEFFNSSLSVSFSQSVFN